MTTFYWKGDRAEYTGKSEVLHGERCYEAMLLEGHRKGETSWTYRAPPNAVSPWSTSSGALTRQLRKDLKHARKQGGAA